MKRFSLFFIFAMTTASPFGNQSAQSSAAKEVIAIEHTKIAATHNRCKNNGVYNATTGHCSCQPLFEGEKCESFVCSFEGTAHVSNKGACYCHPMFTGQHCEQITSCMAGRLVNNKCYCKEHYSGTLCQYRCVGGRFIAQNNTCLCDTDYFGTDCSCHKRELATLTGQGQRQFFESCTDQLNNRYWRSDYDDFRNMSYRYDRFGLYSVISCIFILGVLGWMAQARDARRRNRPMLIESIVNAQSPPTRSSHLSTSSGNLDQSSTTIQFPRFNVRCANARLASPVAQEPTPPPSYADAINSLPPDYESSLRNSEQRRPESEQLTTTIK